MTKALCKMYQGVGWILRFWSLMNKDVFQFTAIISNMTASEKRDGVRFTLPADLLGVQLLWRFRHVFLIRGNCTQMCVCTRWPFLSADHPELFQNWAKNQPTREKKIFRKKSHFIKRPWLNINSIKENKHTVALSLIWLCRILPCLLSLNSNEPCNLWKLTWEKLQIMSDGGFKSSFFCRYKMEAVA